MSLLVEVGPAQDQFSSDLHRVTLAALEQLATKVLAVTPPPLVGATSRQSASADGTRIVAWTGGGRTG